MSDRKQSRLDFVLMHADPGVWVVLAALLTFLVLWLSGGLP